MKITKTIGLEVKDMYSFLMRHAYKSFSGVLWLLLSIIMAVAAIATAGDVPVIQTLLMTILALLYTVINPYFLYQKAKQQILRNDYYKEPLTYVFSPEGIEVNLKDETATTEWDSVWKAVETRRDFIIYCSTVRAFILPKKNFTDDYNDFVEIIRNALHERAHIKKRK